jgi:hypothetical protein
MTLAELVEAEGPGDRFPPRCRVAMVRAALNARDQEILDRLLADVAWTATRIAELVGRAGHDLTATSIARHRRGQCRCSRTS